jgi:serine/threonine protein kinase
MRATHLGKYRIIRLLATGGMGEVFLARQEGPAGFSKPAVVKRILAHLAREPGFVQMFLDEARLAAMLSHPNIVQIFELGEVDGTWFIAMEYLHGRSLKAIRKQAQNQGRPVDPVQAARMMSNALAGLQYAHHALGQAGEPLNIVHRDMSPDNVMVGFNGVVKVLDFGIAKASSAITTTRTGTVKGKYAYMAPEQVLSEPVDPRTDVYGVGVVLYELLAGTRPFVANVEAALINLILNAQVPPLSEKAPHVPPALSAIVMKALERNRADRWASAQEFSDALEGFIASCGQPNSGAATAAYLKSLFGEEANENPTFFNTPSELHPIVLPAVEVLLETRAVPPPGPPVDARKRRAVLGAVIAVPLLAVGIAIALPSKPARVETPPMVEPVGLEARAAPLLPKPPEPPSPVVEAAPTTLPPPPPLPRLSSSGKVDLRINPWGEVFEAGKSLGVTPMAPLELPAGVHSLMVTNSELNVTRQLSVKVPRGGTVTLRIDLLE